jgi:transketolase
MRKSCLDTIYNLAKTDSKVIFIGSDLGPGVLDEFKKNIPDKFLMEGVSEQSIIGMSAGLAIEGLKPYVNTIATFITRRCFEQIVIDICLHNLSVRLIGNGGGLVYAPLGPTHQAIEDISILRVLPNITILAPCDSIEMKELVKQTLSYKGPVYIRIARGGEEIITNLDENIKISQGVLKKQPKNHLFITTGVMTQIALKASEDLKKNNIGAGVLHLATVKPLDKEMLSHWIPKVKKIITVEEGLLAGGFGSSILEFCSDNLPNDVHKISRIGLKDSFIEKYGTQDLLFNDNNLTKEYLISEMLK